MFETKEGIVISSSPVGTGYIDTSDVRGDKHEDVEVISLSKSLIESVDLISEGPIEGLVSGTWTFSGVLGEIGYRSGQFTPYKIPAGYTGVQYLHSIYWNEVPVIDESGRFNFQSVDITSTIGKPNGEQIQTLSPFQKTSRTIGERLRKGFPKTYRILNKDCQGVVVNIKIPQLSYSNPDNGNILRTSIEYNLSYRPVFSDKIGGDYILAKRELVFGKVQTGPGYVRPTRVDFTTNAWNQNNFIAWEVKVERTTEESTSSLLRNLSYVDSITEIQGNIYTYPNSAMVRSQFDAEYFSSVPNRAFDTNLLKVKIPGNYNPILRTYNTTGFGTTNSGWNGLFTTGKYWTNNPAWCFYDLITNKRYGLGKYIDTNFVDKFSLYEIGQYCDTLVSNGEGGLEPRFTSNVWITSRDDAYKVVNDMASIFRGLTYYANGLIYTTQDSPKECLTVFTNTNVENGDFNYSSTAKKNRHSVATVRYNDPLNFYKPAVEYVEDLDSIRKYGVREFDFSAFGCTSRGQAIRLGRWILLSENLETETVSFIAGLEANYLKPGDVFKVFDVNKKIKRHAGRTISIYNKDTTGSRMVLDGNIDLESNVEYNLSVVTPSFNYNSTQVSGLTSNDIPNIKRPFVQSFIFTGFQATTSGKYTVLDLGKPFDTTGYYISGRPVWSLEVSDRYEDLGYTGIRYFTNQNYDYFKVINIKENESHRYEINGLQYNPAKFIEIESGLVLQRNNLVPNKIPASPYNLKFNVIEETNNLRIINYSFLVDDTSNINSYKVYVSNHGYVNNAVPSSDLLVSTLPVETTNDNYSPLSSGIYDFRIYSSNDIDNILSASFASGSVEIDDIRPIYDVIISALQMNSYSGTYSGSVTTRNVTIITSNDSDPTFNWQVGFQNSSSIDNNLKYRLTFRSIDEEGSRIPSQTILHQVTGLTTTQYQFGLDANIALNGGPYRSYQLVVEAHDSIGNTSAGNRIGVFPEEGWNSNSYGYDILDVHNPRQTGIELSNNFSTQISGLGPYLSVTAPFASRQFMGSNGELVIQFSSGTFNEDLVGGYIYTASTQFPKQDILARDSFWGSKVQKTRFSFDPVTTFIYSPTACFNIRGSPYAFVSLSLFDSIDEAIIDKGTDLSSTLYISNNSIALNDAAVGTLTVGGVQTLQTVQITGNGDNALIGRLIGSGSVQIQRVVIPSGGPNIPSTLTTIFYMAPSITGTYFYTGVGGIGGIGAVSNESGRLPGGFGSGNSNVLVGDGYTPISSLRTGDTVTSYILKKGTVGDSDFNYTGDNWSSYKSASYFMSPVSGVVSRINKSTVNNYIRINDMFNLTPEQPVFVVTSIGNFNDPQPNRFFPAQSLEVGHWIVDQFIDTIEIFQIDNLTGALTTYSLEVSPYRLFALSGGLSAHNSLYLY